MMRRCFVALALFFLGCSGCATRNAPEPPEYVIADISLFTRSALHTLHAATTGTLTGNEIGLCLTGWKSREIIHVTGVSVPPIQTGNTRTSVMVITCEGVPDFVGRAHFHPYGTPFGCHRSSVDARSHAVLGFLVDVVVCPRGKLRWYTTTASGT